MDNLPNCCRQCWQKKRIVDHGLTEDSHAHYNIYIYLQQCKTHTHWGTNMTLLLSFSNDQPSIVYNNVFLCENVVKSLCVPWSFKHMIWVEFTRLIDKIKKKFTSVFQEKTGFFIKVLLNQFFPSKCLLQVHRCCSHLINFFSNYLDPICPHFHLNFLRIHLHAN